MRLALVTDVPTPYRDALFHAISEAVPGSFRVLFLGKRVSRRSWTIGDPKYDALVLRDAAISFGEHALHLFSYPNEQLRTWAPDVVVIAGWNQPGYWAARSWCRRSDVPAVAWVESHAASGSRRGTVSNALRRRFLTGLAGAVVASTESAEFLAGFGFHGPTLVWPNAVVPPARPRALLAPAAGECTLLFLGALHPRKNPGWLLTMAAAARASGESARIIYAGTGALAGELRKEADRLGVGATFTGYVEGEPLEDLWDQSHCLVLPSRADPAPLVLSEAAARGVPFLASDACGAASTLVDFGATGSVLSLSAGSGDWWRAASTLSRRGGQPLPVVLPDRAASRLVGFLPQCL